MNSANRLPNAISTIERELGVNPSDTYSTVKNRLDNLEAHSKGYKIRKQCCLCGDKLQVVLSLGETALANQFISQLETQTTYPLTLARCLNIQCGHFQLLEIINPDLLFKNYAYVSGTSEVMRQHFQRYADKIINLISRQDKPLVVDLGSNDGTLLKYLMGDNIRSVGVEPATNLATRTQQEGIPIFNTFFNVETANLIKQEYGLADVITCNNCFAHTEDLDQIMLGVKQLLKPDGVFIFEVSDFNQVVKTLDFSQIYHEHTSYHQQIPLIRYIEQKKFGMFIDEIEKLPVHGGSIRCYVRKGRYHSNYTVPIGCDWNYEVLHFDQDFNYFQSQIQKFKLLKDKLLLLKQQGKKIVGITASAKSTTFLHYCDLGNDILDYICDDAPEKQYQFSPGKQIPIKPFSALYQDAPDYAVLLSFNFVDFIQQQHSQFQGQWVNPWGDWGL